MMSPQRYGRNIVAPPGNQAVEPRGRLRFEQSNLIVMQESAEGIRGVGSPAKCVEGGLETSRTKVRRSHPAKGPNGAACRMAGVNERG
ncbi:MAG: hypothetical protein JRJ38_17570 [Deltaproteobacteria bacterium]|nr:hypothetical protein [Deltaproteobacteria bacterium]